MNTKEGYYEGYAVEDLRKVFAKVQDPTDWKAPIAIITRGEHVGPVVAAIRFFTATNPTVSMNVNVSDKYGYIPYYIESEGYRLGPAGDH